MKVTVVMTTYNHERFLAQAVESALMQETDFEYEIVIIEDFSTDRTRAIAVELQERHPAKIRLVLPPRNCNDSRNRQVNRDVDQIHRDARRRRLLDVAVQAPKRWDFWTRTGMRDLFSQRSAAQDDGRTVSTIRRIRSPSPAWGDPRV
jgi:glycosyltransferase involved in cell wall biosynthesis